ncbi:MAG: sulfur carrier protein ThiS [Phycisphaerales bacterium]|nr:sulfur carrier protein ThiS [Phycisphaerales bacterium]
MVDLPTAGGAGEGPTVAELLERRGVRAAACAVEINQKLAPRRTHGEVRVREGDVVEIVTLVGGG